ncbi:hypothetical protein J41TS12_41080 [Paenibacillus antibioticophila]|uniref:Uncharacterized protein n=1 Tax=Paenibacillus antibioticophila TaxID=1274374 RepID=A0A919XZ31_9BACL|nr:hypothetical protein J41TS12_41080 [Paenibacillus antibioticophila]
MKITMKLSFKFRKDKRRTTDLNFGLEGQFLFFENRMRHRQEYCGLFVATAW